MLALVTSLCFGSVALADGPTEVVVIFSGDEPDITISSHFVGAHGLEEGTSLFTLEGASYAEGCITASASPTGGQWGPWGSAEVSGWFDAENGDFDSFFGSMMTEQYKSGTWHVTQEGYNEHSLSATGVTNLHVQGWALSTSYNNTETPSAGQLFNGEADSVCALGVSLLKWDSDYDGNLDSSYGASIDLSGEGSPFGFEGYTDSSRSLYPECYVWGSHPDVGSLRFDVDITGSSIDGELETNYPYTSMVASDGAGNSIGTQITYNTGWAIIEAFNADRIDGQTAT